MSAPLTLFYGGSFNPVHIGHARLAIEVCTQIKPHSFSFVPCKAWGDKPPFAATDAQRIAMLDELVEQLQATFTHDEQIGVGVQTQFEVEHSDLECSGPSYTVDSINRLAQMEMYINGVQRHIVWVLGMDSWEGLTQWHQWQKLTDNGSLLVVNRPGYSGQIPQEQTLWAKSKTVSLSEFGEAGTIAFIETSPLQVSSSQIRKLIAQQESAKFLMPEPVLRYVEEVGLYKNIGLLANE